MLAGVNDQLEHAHQLGQLLQGRDVVLNLIPWNPVYSPGISFGAPQPEAIAAFWNLIASQYGIRVTVRQEKGSDIASRCHIGSQHPSCRSAGEWMNCGCLVVQLSVSSYMPVAVLAASLPV